jgi:quercetin dioxygenase-like cupin family protein
MKYTGSQLAEVKPDEKLPGFFGKFIHTEDMTLAYWDIKKGSVLPEHTHMHTQIAQVISGEFAMTIGGEGHIYRAGNVVEIPGDVPHSGTALTDCIIHDIFLPVREDLK